jgi:hypothetical protein
MIYQGTSAQQPKPYVANLEYLDPDGIKRQLSETLRDYCIYAFAADPDWEEDKITARKVHENAEIMLRTMFNELPAFKTKVLLKKSLKHHHTLSRDESPGSVLLDELVQVCEEGLEGTAETKFCKQLSADTPEQLKTVIDPYLTTPPKFSKPVFWPLIRQVRYVNFSLQSTPRLLRY